MFTLEFASRENLVLLMEVSSMKTTAYATTIRFAVSAPMKGEPTDMLVVATVHRY